MKHIASVSGGKDSTAMLLRLLELRKTEPDRYPLDEVVFCDTTMEFPEMYEHLAKLRAAAESAGIRWVTVKPPRSFEYLLYQDQYKRRDGTQETNGRGRARPHCRWCTGMLKTQWINTNICHKDKNIEERTRTLTNRVSRRAGYIKNQCQLIRECVKTCEFVLVLELSL